MKMHSLENFADSLALTSATESELAVALIWFLTHQEHHTIDVPAKDIAKYLSDFRLRSQINLSRLAKNLNQHPDLVKGKEYNSYRIKATSDKKLSLKYKDFAEFNHTKIKDDLIPNSINFGIRKIFNDLRTEANGTYEKGFYNSSATMCRRLMETLLIEVFDAQNKIAEIIENGEFKQLSDIIGVAKSGNFIRLSRASKPILDKVKQVGDNAAHGRYYNTSKKDLDDLNPSFRVLLSELATLAKLEVPKS